MADRLECTFLYVLAGDRNLTPVPVDIKVNNKTLVGHLKEWIRAQSKMLKSIDPWDIRLYQIEIPIENRSIPLQRAVAWLQQPTNEAMDQPAEQLDEARKLHNAFPNGPKDEHIHIIVQVLAAHAMVRDGSGSGSGVPGTKYSHSRDVDMGTGHPVESGAGLSGAVGVNIGSQAMTRDRSGSSDGTSVSRRPGGITMGADNSQGGQEISLSILNDFKNIFWNRPGAQLFPLKIENLGQEIEMEYIDISNIERALGEMGFALRHTKKLLIREEYRLAYEYLRESAANDDQGVAILGQPGIGKSAFLFYAMIRQFHTGQPVLFHVEDGCYLFTAQDVTKHPFKVRFKEDIPGLEGKRVWGLSNSGPTTPTPPGRWVTDQKVFIVQATSPKEFRFKQWVKEATAPKYVMDVWSEQELRCLAATVPLDIKGFLHLASKFGPSPRNLLSFSHNQDTMREMEGTISNIAKRLARNPHGLTDLGELGSVEDAPSNLIFIRPSEARFIMSPYIPTEYLSLKIANAVQEAEAEEQLRFWRITSSDPKARSLAGWIFEDRVHRQLATGKSMEFVDINGQVLQPVQGSTNVHCGSNALKAAINADEKEFYWTPGSNNFKGIDCCLLKGNNFYFIQATISSNHTTPEKGIEIVARLAKKKFFEKKGCYLVYFAPDVPTRDALVSEAAEQQMKIPYKLQLNICGCAMQVVKGKSNQELKPLNRPLFDDSLINQREEEEIKKLLASDLDDEDVVMS